jgi:hypothetical protein
MAIAAIEALAAEQTAIHDAAKCIVEMRDTAKDAVDKLARAGGRGRWKLRPKNRPWGEFTRGWQLSTDRVKNGS